MPHDRVASPLLVLAEADYVVSFAALTRVQREIRSRGPSPTLLLQRAMLEMALGNYGAALDAARDAATVSPRLAEAHYQQGLAWMCLARVQVGATPLGPGAPVPVQRPLRLTLRDAHEAFRTAVQFAGHDDDARAAVAYTKHLLGLDQDCVARLLRGA